MFSNHLSIKQKWKQTTYFKNTKKNLASLTFLDASKDNKSATKEHHSSKS